MTESSSTPGGNGPAIDSSMPHSARVWNYWLGGKDFYPVDRVVGDQVMQMFPDISQLARADRAFLGRAVRFLAGEAGIRQFLDIGTGLPTANNTHQVAQAIAPSSRIVYVDNDPLVLVHARALLTSTSEGACDYIDADMRDTATILSEAARTLDFSRPGKPTDNAFIEAFNGRFRAECLNAHWFLSLADARGKLEDWRKYYNEERPHGAIGQMTPIMLLNYVGATSPPP